VPIRGVGRPDHPGLPPPPAPLLHHHHRAADHADRTTIQAIDQDAWTDIVDPEGAWPSSPRPASGERLVVGRPRLTGAQAELFSHLALPRLVTDRPDTTVWLDQDHRRHARVELAIGGLKGGSAGGIIPGARSPPTPPGW
jgi:hypothetical protein